jgi:SP family xylose:H+ symportor-like MFS transporter
MLVIYFVNYFIAKSGDQAWLDGIGWRWMFASETIPAALFLVLLIFVPETPRFMVMKNQDDKALSVLQKLNGAEKSAGILGKSRNRSK